MNRLPTPGQDNGTWGNLLNEFLRVEHNDDGTLKKAGAISAAQSTADAKYTKPATGIPESDLSAGVQGKLNGSAQVADGSVTDAKVAANAAISQSKIGGLDASLANKADLNHAHSISQVSGLQAALDAKQDTGSGSPSTLDALTDVDTTDALDGNALVYSGGTWSPANVGSGGTGSIPDDNSVSSVKLTTSSVTTIKIADLNVTGAKIADGTIGNAKIAANAAIDQSKISGLTASLTGKANTAHTHAASDITSGVLAPTRLGSGTPGAGNYLRGDGTWAAVSGGGSVAAADITDATTVGRNVLKAADAAAARSAIGAGTSNLSLGTSSTTALAGDFAADAAATYAPKASPTFTGAVVVPSPTQATHATNKSYVDGRGDLAPVTSGISWSGNVDAGSLAFPGTHRRSLTGNTVVTGFPLPPSTVSGTMTIKVIQSATGTGQYTIQWPDGIYWAKGKSAPQAPTVAGDWIIVHFFWDGLYWSGVMQGEYAD